MTDKEIEQAEKELCEIENMEMGSTTEQREQRGYSQKEKVLEWMKAYGVRIPFAYGSERDLKWVNQIFESAHRFLQTKMMLNACISASESGELAKRSCRWAAIAAIISLIATIAAWITVVLTLRGV